MPFLVFKICVYNDETWAEVAEYTFDAVTKMVHRSSFDRSEERFFLYLLSAPIDFTAGITSFDWQNSRRLYSAAYA